LSLMKSSKMFNHRWTSSTMSRSVKNCSPWLREQAGDFYDAGVKKLVPRLTKYIAIHCDYVE
jgi:hypothetical protein